MEEATYAKLSFSVTHRPLDHTGSDFHQKLLVALHLFLGHLLPHHFPCAEKIIRKTCLEKYTSTSLQMVPVPLQAQLWTWNNRLHDHDGNIYRTKFNLRTSSSNLDGRCDYIHFLWTLLWSHWTRFIRAVHRQNCHPYRLLQPGRNSFKSVTKKYVRLMC